VKPKIYGIRNCDTMKKAFAWLDAQGIGYEFHDYKKDGVPAGKLQEWAARPAGKSSRTCAGRPGARSRSRKKKI